MATTNKSGTTRKTTSKSTKAATSAQKTIEAKNDILLSDTTDVVEVPSALSDVIAPETPVVDIDFMNVTRGVKIHDDTFIDVKSNFFGGLTYHGKDGDFRWSVCGEVIQMPFSSLREIKSKPTFFESQWIVPLRVSDGQDCDATPGDIFKILGIERYYKSIVDPSSFRDICEKWTPTEIAERVPMMPTGVRENLKVALLTYVEKRVLNDLNLIDAWGKALGINLLESR